MYFFGYQLAIFWSTGAKSFIAALETIIYIFRLAMRNPSHHVYFPCHEGPNSTYLGKGLEIGVENLDIQGKIWLYKAKVSVLDSSRLYE